MEANEKLDGEVAALGDLSREQLVHRWASSYGCPPPKGVKRGLLERAAAWRVQSKSLGGLSPECRRALKDAMRHYKRRLDQDRPTLVDCSSDGEFADAAVADPKPGTAWAKPHKHEASSRAPRSALSPGTRLLREWNGRQHNVEVAEDGYILDGKTYRSLSAVARRITGAHWSGPRFFGL
ncbi:DUF2924 domain-containing protein [Shinella sp.]|uniref:DUF2924 domain-containing protein n=1 Tax=Shinella sp. TaxID=1870904 RepID=UPI003F70436A